MVTLKDLFEHFEREVYIKIENINDKNTIIGRPTGGSISIDGASGLRRTCQLPFVVEDQNQDCNLAKNMLINVEIGLFDFVGVNISNDNNLPYYKSDDNNIIWFKQGQFVITSFNKSTNLQGININISGQDKMCKLNGTVSGVLRDLSTNYSKKDVEQSDGTFITVDVPLKEIIRNLLIVYGGEDSENIEINTDEAENKAFQLLEYRNNDSSLYILFPKPASNEIENTVPKAFDISVFSDWKDSEGKRIDSLGEYYIPSSIISEKTNFSIFKLGENEYFVSKVEYGQVAGYEKLPSLVYPGDLTAAAGETITSLLDKIKGIYGEYEYFYDVNGKFHFEKKKTYTELSWNWETNNVEIKLPDPDKAIYEFNNKSLFTSFGNTPDLKNLKNDFTVWGNRKGLTGADLPIHMRLAIDEKPQTYTSPYQKTADDEFITYDSTVYDWRELIYQMAVDNYGNEDSNSSAKTGYEQYYTDLLGFWRQLYNPNIEEQYSKVVLAENPTHKEKGWEEVDLAGDNSLLNVYEKVYTDIYENIIIENEDIYSKYASKELYYKDNEDNIYMPVMEQIQNEDGSFTYKQREYDSNLTYYVREEKYVQALENFNLMEMKIEDPYYKDENMEEGQPKPTLELEDCFYEDPETKEIKAITERVYEDNIYYCYDDIKQEFILLSQQLAQFKEAEGYSYYYKNLLTNEYIKVKDSNIGQEEDLSSALYVEIIVDNGKEKVLAAEYFHHYDKNLALKDAVSERKLYVRQGDGIYKSILELMPLDKKKIYVKVKKYYQFANGILQKNGWEPLYKYLSTNSTYYKYDSTIIAIDPQSPIPLRQYETYISRTDNSGNPISLDTRRAIPYYRNYTDYYGEGDHKYWNKNVFNAPEALNFWFDFIDPGEDTNHPLHPFTIKAMGRRPLVKEESTVKTIYYQDSPAAYYGQEASLQIPEKYKGDFVISSRGQSAFDIIGQWITNHTYITESTTIESLPIYSLDVNQVIIVDGEQYFIDKITLPLSYNGTMSINAIKAPKTLDKKD